MFIITKATLDIETMKWISVEGFNYYGPVELCKGDSTAKAAEQEQNTFDQQLMNIFQSQYGNQSAALSYLQGKMEPIINAGGTGYTDAQLASMRTGATDANSSAYQNAQAALQNQITQASGGSKLTGVAGATTQDQAALLNAEAQAQAGSQEQITQANANLQQQNYWNAINALNGVATEENPLGYAGAATGGSDAVAGLSQAYTASNQSQLLGALGGIAGGVGTALGGGFSKGGLFAGCWIFASFFGWNDIRTWVMRLWLNTQAPKWFRDFYLTFGEQISRTPFRWAFRPLATYILARA
jgi:hypothetical protein